jgi:hypothetical protein
MNSLKPDVSRHWLFLLAGVMWTGVGVMLLVRAWGWLAAMPLGWELGLALTSAVIAALFYKFMFTNTVAKNIRRVCQLPDPVCIFAFNSPRGYILIVFMIAMGIALRRSGLDTRILALVYASMGGALLLASLHFYNQFHRVRIAQLPCQADESHTISDAETG